ncbi:unnamed protein product [Heterobilharzia americana]|nr:unnamed protein product [Heterobilharzia americana]
MFICINFNYILFVDSAGDVSVTILPLFIIVGITMIKDGLEDILRHRTDKQLNSVEIQVLNFDFNKQHIQWIIKRAQSLSVGDVILCKINQVFPCDILLLASSNPTGQVCITTANLDGESNTKKYYTIPRMQTIYSKYINNQLIEKNLKHHSFEHNVEQLYLKVNCQQPNEQLYTFEGRYTSKHSNDTNLPLVITNLALRGARLISTEYVIGMVLYTGKDTKLSLNSKQAKRKYSSREGLSNMILLIFMVLMLGLTIILSILSTIWIKNNSLNIWYVTFEELTAWQFIRTIFRFLFIINYLIPISIIVTIEFQQLLLAFNISNDIEMYNSYDDIRSRANNAQLADELGQVEFLFSDKTGTLTQNQMILRSCCILDNEQVYKCDDSYYMNNKTAGNAFKTNKDEVLQVYSSSSESDDDNESLENKNHKHDTMIPKRNKTKVNYNITHPKIPALCHTVDLDSSKITISQNYEGDISNDIDESYTGDRNEPMKNINKKLI